MDCGCEVVHNWRPGAKYSHYINYCPLHAAAEKMQELLDELMGNYTMETNKKKYEKTLLDLMTQVVEILESIGYINE